MSISKSVLKSLVLGVLILGLLSACSATAPAAGSAAEPTTAVVSVAESSTASTSEETTTSTASDAIVKLNLNSASAADFLTIPGVGDRMVREFMEYRPYTSIQQFEREIGKYVSADQVAAYEQYVYVPISINEADAATLQQIPSLDAVAAQALIAARPYDSNEVFLNALAQYISADSLTIASTYLETP